MANIFYEDAPIAPQTADATQKSTSSRCGRIKPAMLANVAVHRESDTLIVPDSPVVMSDIYEWSCKQNREETYNYSGSNISRHEAEHQRLRRI